MPGGEGIKIFARIKPTKRPSKFLELDPDAQAIKFNIPRDTANGILVNNSRTTYNFKFDGIFGMDATQDDIFNVVAKNQVDSVLEGYNGTIFAYGQTGSGKTFTITGGTERYADRGVIPRVLSYLFERCKKDTEAQYTIYISFLEIYNNSGFDLLDAAHEDGNSMEDLQKVVILEDENGNMHLKGLSMNLAASEEEALNLLFVGDTNRAMSETVMNANSSRSHCIFTVSVESRRAGSDIIRRSKLNLVDLAGSERTHKTGATGQLLRESKYINSSLHFLEVCIMALGDVQHGTRSHVPYRNSVMTSVLRDSLGGNCKTSMIATLSAEKPQTEETISTAKFAQRVALVHNKAEINEERDPKLVIKRLKAEIKDLKSELSFLRKGGGEDGEEMDLTQTELNHLRNKIRAFLLEPDPNAALSLGEEFTFKKMQAAFAIFKEVNAGGGAGAKAAPAEGGGGGSSEVDSAELQKLREALARRDHEIEILVKMAKRANNGGNAGATASNRSGAAGARSSSSSKQSSAAPSATRTLIPPELLDDKKKAFEYYCKNFADTKSLDIQKKDLKERYGEAKETGARVNETRRKINKIKTSIEQLRVKKSMLQEGKHTDEELQQFEAREDELFSEFELAKQDYKINFANLRGMRSEIEHIQKLMEKSKKVLLKQFGEWFELMKRQQKEVP